MDYKFKLSGKTAVITGAAGGIGFEVTDGFLQNGAENVFMVDFNHDALEQCADKMKAAYPEQNIFAITADLTKQADIANVVEEIKKTGVSVDILVNNAGIARDVYSMNETAEGWSKVVDLNLTAQFFMSQAIANAFLIPQKHGRIINMCSLGGIMGIPSAVAYSASKGGVLQMTKSLGAEWARFGIQVNCVCPGFVDTPLIAETKKNERWLAYVTMRNPMKRLANADDIVGSVLFLASNYANFINGTSVVVDGGYSCSG
ncbi:MAG: SDR family NAD(P)-dependent oxidoreductase [Acutalibacteraceae bacterium]|nr:SDR family NAD(P)-dependent oxidoreductase [Oscillospiraceae bacterium]